MVSDAPAEPSFLARLAQAADTPLGMDTAQVAPYLDVLDRAIEDRRLSPAEQGELHAAAAMLELSADRVRKLHGDYVGTLVAVARRDGIVTDREREQRGTQRSFRWVASIRPNRLSSPAMVT